MTISISSPPLQESIPFFEDSIQTLYLSLTFSSRLFTWQFRQFIIHRLSKSSLLFRIITRPVLLALQFRRSECGGGLGWAGVGFRKAVKPFCSFYIKQQYSKTMDASSRLKQRQERMNGIRLSFKEGPLAKNVALQVEAKLEKMRFRKKSACLDEPLLDKKLTDSESESEDDVGSSLFNDLYKLGEKIGQGAHGVVKKCYHRQTGQLLAVKTIMLDREHILYLKENFIDIKRLKHPNIIGYKAIFFEMNNEKCHLVMDYLPFPDLLHIEIKSEQQLKELVYQVVQTLDYIHLHKICHRDIKPENILYDEQHQKVILIDFGISKKLLKRGIKRDMLTLTGTPYYRAPEMFVGGGYDEMVDMWALGITIFKLITGITPFESIYHSDTICQIMKGEYSFPPQAEAKYSKQARLFISKLLKKKEERINAREALYDLWFIDLEKKIDEATRSMNLKDANYSHLFSVSMHAPILTRNNTSREENPRKHSTDHHWNLQEERVKLLRDFGQTIDEEESMIYGCEGDTPTPKTS